MIVVSKVILEKHGKKKITNKLQEQYKPNRKEIKRKENNLKVKQRKIHIRNGDIFFLLSSYRKKIQYDLFSESRFF